jgi:hypothetical protein
VTWHPGLAWTAACITGAIVCAGVWLVAQEPSLVHLFVLVAAVLLGGVPTTAGVLVAQGRDTRVLGFPLVLPGLVAAVVLILGRVRGGSARRSRRVAGEPGWLRLR